MLPIPLLLLCFYPKHLPPSNILYFVLHICEPGERKALLKRAAGGYVQIKKTKTKNPTNLAAISTQGLSCKLHFRGQTAVNYLPLH